MRIEAERLIEMRDAIKRAVPRPFDSAILLEVGQGVLTGTAVGDGIWANYFIEVDTDEESKAVVGYKSLDVLDSMRGDVTVKWNRKSIGLSSNMAAKLTHKEVDFSVFDKPKTDEGVSFVEVSPRLSNLAYAAGSRKMDADIFWFSDGIVICGSDTRSATLLDGPKVGEVAVRATFINRVSGGELGFTHNRVWSRKDNLMCSMPTFDKPLALPHKVIAGQLGALKVVGSVAVDRGELLNIVKSLVVLSVDRERALGTIRVVLESGRLQLDAAGNELGSGVATLDTENSQGGIDVHLSPVYLHGALVNSRGETVTMSRCDVAYEGKEGMLFTVEDGEVRHGLGLQGGSK